MSYSPFQNHPIHSLNQQLLQLESNSAFYGPEVSASEHHLYWRDHIFAFAKMLKAHLDSTPHVLTSLAGLNQIQSHVQNAVNEINAFIGNKNFGHLSNASNAIDNGAMAFFWAFLEAPKTGKETPKIIDGLRESSQQTIALLQKAKDELINQMAALKSELDAHSSKVSELTETIAIQKAEALSVTAQVQKEFSEQEQKRSEIFSNISSTMKDSFQTFRNTSSQEAGDLISELENKKEEAAKIVQVVGNIGVTGNYQKIAQEESTQANLWRWITVGLFAVGIAVAITTFLKFLENEPTAENTFSALVRLFYAFAVVAPAWYAAKESAKHRKNSDRARQTELELASLGPFIELMPDEKKIGIREELARRYFGKDSTASELPAKDRPDELKEFMLEVLKALRK